MGKSKGQADQIDFDTFLKTEKVAKLEWRKPPNFTFTAELVTPVTPAAAVQLANWGPELGPASVLTFTWKLVLGGHFPTACWLPVWQAGCRTELTTRRRDNLSTYLDQYSLSKNMVVVKILQDFEAKIHSLYD